MSPSLPSVSLILHPSLQAHGHSQGDVVRGVLTVEVPPGKACPIECITAYLECVTQGEEEHVKEYDRVEFKGVSFERGSHALEVELKVPKDAPISYAFANMKVSWQVRVSLGVRRSVDDGGQVTEPVKVNRGSGPLPQEMLQSVVYNDLFYGPISSQALRVFLLLFVALLCVMAGGVCVSAWFMYARGVEVLPIGAGGLVIMAFGLVILRMLVAHGMESIMFDDQNRTCTPGACRAGEPFEIDVSCVARRNIDVDAVRVTLIGSQKSVYWRQDLTSEDPYVDALAQNFKPLPTQPVSCEFSGPLHVKKGERLEIRFKGQVEKKMPSSFRISAISDELCNEVEWRLRVVLEIPRWPNVTWMVPIRVV